jgi:hypothetical protein
MERVAPGLENELGRMNTTLKPAEITSNTFGWSFCTFAQSDTSQKSILGMLFRNSNGNPKQVDNTRNNVVVVH